MRKYFKNLKSINWQKLALELIVVFLGVTSGFILNNNKAINKEKEIEIKYLKGFLNEVVYNIEELNGMQAADSIWMLEAGKYVSSLKSKSLSVDSAELLMMSLMNLNQPNFKKITYIDIVNSGNLNLIRNYDLKEKIVQYYLQIDETTFLYDFFNDYFNSHVMPFTIQHFDLLNRHFQNPSMANSAKFSNVFVGYYAMIQQRKVMHDSLLMVNKEIQIELFDELKSLD